MNIIFLDIDGVLNNELFYNDRYERMQKPDYVKPINRYDEEFCKLNMQNLNEIVTKVLDTKVVISSTWRIGKSTEELQQLLNEQGFLGEVIGKTPSFSYKTNKESFQSVPRGVEIDYWLNNYIEENPKIQKKLKYVILDDDSDMLYNQRHFYFNIDPYTGLTHNHAYKIIRFFNNKIT